MLKTFLLVLLENLQFIYYRSRRFFYKLLKKKATAFTTRKKFVIAKKIMSAKDMHNIKILSSLKAGQKLSIDVKDYLSVCDNYWFVRYYNGDNRGKALCIISKLLEENDYISYELRKGIQNLSITYKYDLDFVQEINKYIF